MVKRRRRVDATPDRELLLDAKQPTHLLEGLSLGLDHGVPHEHKRQDADARVDDVQTPADGGPDGRARLGHDVTTRPQGHGRYGVPLCAVRDGEDLARVGPRPYTPTDVETDIEQIREDDDGVISTVSRKMFSVPLKDFCFSIWSAFVLSLHINPCTVNIPVIPIIEHIIPITPICNQVFRPSLSKTKMGTQAKTNRTIPIPPVARFRVCAFSIPPR